MCISPKQARELQLLTRIQQSPEKNLLLTSLKTMGDLPVARDLETLVKGGQS